MRAIAGIRSSGTCRECCRWRYRRSLDMIRLVLPYHLRNLAHVGTEVILEVEGPITQRSVLDALEARYPMLRGTIRDHGTLQRRPVLRLYAYKPDLSNEPPGAPRPERAAS